MTIGKLIIAARKKLGIRQDVLAKAVGMTGASMSDYENDLRKSLDPRTLIRISEALDAPDILIHHCEQCPIRQHIMLKQYPELNNIRKDPSIIMASLAREMDEGRRAAEDLCEKMRGAGFRDRPGFQEYFDQKMEQIFDAERNIEILKFELLLSGTASKGDLDRVRDRQQQKCVENGYHIPERTGTEG